MKSLLAAVGGIALVMMIFAGGIAVGKTFFIEKPAAPPVLDLEADTEVWTSEPRTVNTAAQDFERLPALDATSDVNTDGETQAAAMDARAGEAPADGALIDRTTTASIQPDDDAVTAYDAAIQPPDDAVQALDDVMQPSEEEAGASAEMAAAHMDWCFSRYRSYRAEDDSYTSYSGESRRCESPYSDALAEGDGGIMPVAGDAEASFGEISEASAAEYAAGPTASAVDMTIEHVEDCFRRYRSYRMEDNTYQPYGGGPRQQCL